MTTEHNNEFTFSIPGLTKLLFEERSHSISSGQPYHGVTVKNNNTLIIKAGRHKTKEVANWFTDKIYGGGGISLTYAHTLPEELNFAVCGKLTLVVKDVTYTADNFVVAQGNTPLSNNWWIGSPQMASITQSKVDEKYAKAVVENALSFAKNIVGENPIGAITDTAKLIENAVHLKRVGSGEVPFTMSTSEHAVELLLFQMNENHLADVSLTGTYRAS